MTEQTPEGLETMPDQPGPDDFETDSPEEESESTTEVVENADDDEEGESEDASDPADA